MKCRPSIHKFKVIGVEIKAESRQDREVLRRLCLENSYLMVATDDDYTYIRIPFEEFKELSPNFTGGDGGRSIDAPTTR